MISKTVDPNNTESDNRVLVHADGGNCHGTRLVEGQCPGCGIYPDMQSTELWSPNKTKS
jgi:hypothetical protein